MKTSTWMAYDHADELWRALTCAAVGGRGVDAELHKLAEYWRRRETRPINTATQ
jgi:hypothetical protein